MPIPTPSRVCACARAYTHTHTHDMCGYLTVAALPKSDATEKNELQQVVVSTSQET